MKETNFKSFLKDRFRTLIANNTNEIDSNVIDELMEKEAKDDEPDIEKNANINGEQSKISIKKDVIITDKKLDEITKDTTSKLQTLDDIKSETLLKLQKNNLVRIVRY